MNKIRSIRGSQLAGVSNPKRGAVISQANPLPLQQSKAVAASLKPASSNFGYKVLRSLSFPFRLMFMRALRVKKPRPNSNNDNGRPLTPDGLTPFTRRAFHDARGTYKRTCSAIIHFYKRSFVLVKGLKKRAPCALPVLREIPFTSFVMKPCGYAMPIPKANNTYRIYDLLF